MKRLLNTSMIYLIFALAAGVFYREFTKWNGYTGKTTLGVLHTHLLMLGMFLFLIIALFCSNSEDWIQDKLFKKFFVLHNIALPFMTCMFLVRGIIQVKNIAVNRSVNAMISGIAGISHILITISLLMLFLSLKKHFAR